jgi:hypothetical protein
MSNNHYRLLFVAIILSAVVAITFNTVPEFSIMPVLGYDYGGGSGGSGGGGGGGGGLGYDPLLNDPFVGSAEPAALRVPNGTKITIMSRAELRWAPRVEAGTGMFTDAGNTFSVSGLDITGEWVRLNIGGQSAWVHHSETSLPPIRIQQSFD